MKIKHLIIVSLLLAILTFGAVSATEDGDALAVDDTGDEQVVETPVDADLVESDESSDTLQEVTAEDFNVEIADEIDPDEEDFSVINITYPEDTTGRFHIVGESSRLDLDNRYDIHTTEHVMQFTLDKLNIDRPGIYDFTIGYIDAEGNELELETGTLKVKAYYDADEFRVSVNEKVDMEDTEDIINVWSYPVDGTLIVLVNGNKAYSTYVEENDDIYIDADRLNITLDGKYNISIQFESVYGQKIELKNYTLTLMDYFYDIYVPEHYNLDRKSMDLVQFSFRGGTEGNFIMKIDNVIYYNETLDESSYIDGWNTNLAGVIYGTHDVEVIYTGDKNHDGFNMTYQVDFTYTLEFELDDEESYYGEDLSAVIYLPSNNNGTVEYTINGKKYSVNPDDGEYDSEVDILLKSEDLKYYNNEITITYIGTDYPEKTVTSTFNLTAEIKFSNTQANFDENIYVSILLPEDAEGNLVVYKEVYDEEIWDYADVAIATQSVNDGVANITLNLTNLKLGSQNIYVKYTGKDYKIYFEDGNEFFIKLTPKINMPKKIWINGEYSVDVEFPSDCNEKLYVDIYGNSKSFTLEKGKTTFNLFKICSEGDYIDGYSRMPVILNYYDENHTFEDTYYIILMATSPSEYEFLITDNSSSIVKGYDYSVKAVLPEYADGNITIYVDSAYYGIGDIWKSYDDLDETYLSFSTENLTLGTHTIMYVFQDEYYTAKNVTFDIEVVSINYNVPSEIVIGEYEYYRFDQYVTVQLPDDATGKIKLTIDGTTELIEEVDDTYVRFDLPELTLGIHTLKFEYYGGNYESASKTFNTTAVYKYIFEEEEIYYGYDYEAGIQFPIGATGDVELTIGEKTFKSTINARGFAYFKITGVESGIYNVTFTYKGDGKYPAKTQTSENVSLIYLIDNIEEYNIPIQDLAKNNYTLYISENAKGTLCIYELGEEEEDEEGNFYTPKTLLAKVPVVNGMATISLEDVFKNYEGSIAGEHELKLEYECDDGEKYNVDPLHTWIKITNYKITRTPESNEINPGDNITYYIEFAESENGNLIIYRYKTTYSFDWGWNPIKKSKVLIANTTITNGKGNVTISDLPLGSYRFEFVYDKDSEFDYYDNLMVDPNDVTLSKKVNSGEVFITVELPSDASGSLTVRLLDENGDDKEISANYAGGIASINASSLNSGNYYLSTYIIKDDKYGKYDSSENSAGWILGYEHHFKVVSQETDLIDPALTVSVTNITQGENATITVTTNSTFSGNVDVKIGNNTYVVNVENGKGTKTVSGLEIGPHTATATFQATDKFTQSTKTTTFNVTEKQVAPEPTPINPQLTISVTNITQGENAVITITTNSTFTGNVDVKIGTSNYVVKVTNGKGSKSVSGLGVGTYTATATFNATAIFKESSQSTSFNVAKKPDTISLTVAKFTLKRSAKKVTVKATLKINGKKVTGKKVTLKINGKTYKVKTKKGVAAFTLNKKVLKKFKAGKKYIYTVTYGQKTIKKSVKAKK